MFSWKYRVVSALSLSLSLLTISSTSSLVYFLSSFSICDFSRLASQSLCVFEKRCARLMCPASPACRSGCALLCCDEHEVEREMGDATGPKAFTFGEECNLSRRIRLEQLFSRSNDDDRSGEERGKLFSWRSSPRFPRASNMSFFFFFFFSAREKGI